jgi:PIN like domain
VVIPLAKHYGIPRDQEVADHEWMLEAARHGWPVLGRDAKHRRRRRPAERAALIEAGVQNFILNGNVSALEKAERVLHNLAAILAACATPGPFVYRIHLARIERLLLD